MANCTFCQIIAGQLPSYKLFETPHTLAFLDSHPSVEGHTMVIHKKHGQTIQEYTEAELGQLMAAVQTVSSLLENAFHTNIQTIGINHNEPTGLKHLHIHILPRYPSDPGGIIQSLVRRRILEDLSSTQRRILDAVARHP